MLWSRPGSPQELNYGSPSNFDFYFQTICQADSLSVKDTDMPAKRPLAATHLRTWTGYRFGSSENLR